MGLHNFCDVLMIGGYLKSSLVAVGLVAGISIGSLASASATPDANYYRLIDTSTTLDANGGYADQVTWCNSGDTAVSGGFRSNNDTNFDLQISAPAEVGASNIPTGWEIGGYNYTDTTQGLYTYVECKTS